MKFLVNWVSSTDQKSGAKCRIKGCDTAEPREFTNFLSSCMLAVTRRTQSLQPLMVFCRMESKKVYDHHRNYENEEHKEWFATSERLTKARSAGKPHIVYLEGPPGSGKKDVLGRLAKLGYATSTSNFFALMASAGSSLPEAEREHELELSGFIDNVNSNSDKPGYFKDNLVFRNRSLLSMKNYFCNPQEARKALYKLYPNFSVIMCKADPTVRMQRVGLRQYYAKEKERATLHQLKEDDQEYLDSIGGTYNEYLESKEAQIFDGSVFTTSVKQGAAAILSLYGVKPTITQMQKDHQSR
mmetsp:Transcript_23012/g.29382  ORF Transcript_23012/g.29382 Transcript_23012/m.29382 type:complete len:299 (+) Transcript_23012:93-989(+)